MHFLTLMFAFGACVLITGPLPTQANPQLNPGGITCLSGGACSIGQTCCVGLRKCPEKTRNCGGIAGSDATGGKLGSCIKGGNRCNRFDRCCFKASLCPVKGSFMSATCPSA